MSRTTIAPLTVEYALLGLLQRQPMHGYQLYQELTRPQGLWLIWHLKQGQLYALLAKLEESSYLVSTLEPQAARPPRKIFELTEAGRAVLHQWLSSPVAQPRQMRQEFLAKLYFARRSSSTAELALLAAQRTLCRIWWVEQQAKAAALNQAEGFAQTVAQFRLSQIEALLIWLDRCEQEAHSHGVTPP